MQYQDTVAEIVKNVEKAVIGKKTVVEMIIAAMLSKGCVLIEDVPGVGKTQLVSALANSCGGVFGRMQFTPDIMPNDITGFTMIDTKTHEREFIRGAAFCNFLLADEINRASPKSQSALLEVMEERQVSADGVTYPLPSPFMVLATQNPVETYGTYHLPEAQMDRFIIKIKIGYPGHENELAILENNRLNVNAATLSPVTDLNTIEKMSEEANEVKCAGLLADYIVTICESTRNSEFVRMGASPRGSIALYRMAKSWAYVQGRDYVIPDDIKLIAPFVLSHRLIMTPKGQSVFPARDDFIRDLVDGIKVPV